MPSHLSNKLALAAALASLGMGAACAQSATPATPSSAPKAGTPTADKGMTDKSAAKSADKGRSSLPAEDRKFIEHAAMGGMAEVELGKLAQQKGASAQVKDFGGKLVQDHGKANDELKTLASGKGVTLPTELDKEHRKHVDDLGKKSGDAFDKDFVALMVKDHKKDVGDFEKQAKNAKDADVRNFASKTLPTLQEHLKTVQAMQGSMKGAGKSALSSSAPMSGSTSSGMSGSSSGNTGGSPPPASGGASKGTSGK